MATRDELLTALTGRYQSSRRQEKGRILDEFAAMTGHHRKHAMRLLRAGACDRRNGPRPHRRLYDDAVREALIVLWEASDRICGKRLKALIPTLVPAMERHGHLDLSPAIRAALLAVSAATIDRALRLQRERAGASPRRRSSPSALRRSIPVRTFADWGDPPPGYIEAVNRRGTGDRVRRANGDRGLVSCGDQGSARRSWSGLRSRAEPGSRPGWSDRIVMRGF
jgi:hypothetical protein